MYVIIIIFGLYVGFVVFLWTTRPKEQKMNYRLVKAGSPSCIRPTTVAMKSINYKKYVVNSTVINPSDFEIFIVGGESAQLDEIHDGDAVFVRRIFSQNKLSLNAGTIIVFEIDKNILNIPTNTDIEYKIRHFIDYVKISVPFDEWFDTIDKDKYPVEDQKEFIREKYEQCKKSYMCGLDHHGDLVLAFSSTYDTIKRGMSFSFHPIKFLYGKVEYVVKSKDLPY